MRAKTWWLSTAGIMVVLMFVSVLPTLADGITPTDSRPMPGDVSAAASQAEPVFLRLANGTFDPRQSTPNLPESLAYTPEEAAASGDYIIQFTGPVRQEWKDAIAKLGGQIGGYLPDYAYLVHFDAASRVLAEDYAFVRWIGAYEPAYRVSADVDYNETRSYRVLTLPWADTTSLAQTVASIDPLSRQYEGGFVAVLNGSQVAQAARLPGVLWIEPLYLQQLHNDVGGGNIMNGSAAWSSGYTGSGVVIAVTDTGLDTGNAAAIHQDFAGRVAQISSWPVVYANYGNGFEISNPNANDGASDVDSGHGSHVTGSVAGSGAASGGQIKGLAYQATITFQAVEQWTTWAVPSTNRCPNGYYLTGIPDDVRTLLNQVYGWGARVQNNSWGGGQFGVYDSQASYFDDFVHSHPDMVVVVSAGNSGTDAENNGFVDVNSISSPGTAKNLITIGASDNERSSGGIATRTWGQVWPSDFNAAPTGTDFTSDTRQELAAFSSRGPMNDGRIKPDLVAPGTNILSVRSSLASSNGWGSYNSYYMYMGGTSMASPLSAGAAAQVRDYYLTAESHSPSAALIKATLINTAVDISGYNNTSQEAGMPIPNNHEGWGLINVGAATASGNRTFVDNTTGIGSGTASYQYTVAAGTPFKISLVWSDAPATSSSGLALVNNLNLRVTGPGGVVYLGNVFAGGWSQAGGSADAVNNVECVYVQNPAAGLWTVEVIGANIPVGPQPFALFISGNLSTGTPLTVTSITPGQAYSHTTLNATITGTGFDPAATVSLRMGAAVVNGSSVTVNAEGTSITASFNFASATPGLYDVRVDNPDKYAVLEDGFTLLNGNLPDLSINKRVEDVPLTPNATLTYTISIANDGFANATGVTFTDTLPANVTVLSLSPACLGGRVSLATGFACTIQPSTLAPAASIEYTLVVQLSANPAKVLTNRVEVGSAENDLDPSDNHDSASTGGVRAFLPMVMRNQSLVPGIPTLNAISNADGDGSYTLSWTAGSGAAPTSYDIEEDSVVVVNNHTNTSYNFTGRPVGTHTYRVRARNAAGVSGWSNAQNATVNPPAASLLNGGFENGPDNSWTEYSSNNFDLIVDADYLSDSGGAAPHNGIWAAWLGGYTNEISTLTQAITVPGAGNTLSFYYWSASSDYCGFDLAYVYINSTTVHSIDLCESTNSNGWVEAQVSLAAYANQSVTLQFYVDTDGSFNSSLYLDDISFK